MPKLFVRLAVLLLAVVGTASLVLFWHYRDFLATPLAVTGDGVVIEVPRGAGLRRLSDDLATRGLIDSPDLLVLHGRLSGLDTALKAGEYRLEPGITPPQFLELLASGRVMLHSLTLVEGWTFAQALAAVRATPELVDTLEGLAAEAVMARLGLEGQHPEGRFFPDTYHFPRATTDVEFLRRAYITMQDVLGDAWQRRAEGLPYDGPYEALIMASIIEKETSLPEERDEVAGVFVRRLLKGMRLQADPTVIYGLGEAFDGNLRRSDLRTDTPYNTYTRRGLPPTPIALPGRGAIEAALNPADGKALYFVATGDGRHVFAETLAEHEANVRRYQLGGPRG
ncbi:MAG: endolytic transglycosylase MltG [Gammaproteobacteria bacterium]|nr:endolytic transglycosylase MltG [Gammaproteobacteria bacterium]